MFILLRERRIHHKSLGLLLCLVILGMLLPSAFWYARELQATGNPLYPTSISVGRHMIFPGYQSVMPDAGKLLVDHRPAAQGYGDTKFVRRRAEWWIYPWTEWMNVSGSFPIVYGEGSGFGSAFATFVVVGVGFAIFRCFRVFRVHQESSGEVQTGGGCEPELARRKRFADHAVACRRRPRFTRSNEPTRELFVSLVSAELAADGSPLESTPP